MCPTLITLYTLHTGVNVSANIDTHKVIVIAV